VKNRQFSSTEYLGFILLAIKIDVCIIKICLDTSIIVLSNINQMTKNIFSHTAQHGRIRNLCNGHIGNISLENYTVYFSSF
jgi:hypothetical protein